MTVGHRYCAFISYGQGPDSLLASRLQIALERHGGLFGWKRQRRVFRDETNLTAQPDLWASIESALGQSDFFILLASPEAARSPWVEREVRAFLAREPARFCIALTRGNAPWVARDPQRDEDAIPQFLAAELAARGWEPLLVDLRPFAAERGRSSVQFLSQVATILAAVLGKDKDEVYGEHIKAQRRATWLMALVAFSMLTLLAVALFQYRMAQKRLAQGIAVAEHINDVVDRRLEEVPGAREARKELLSASITLLDELQGASSVDTLVQRIHSLARQGDLRRLHERIADSQAAYETALALGREAARARPLDAKFAAVYFKVLLGVADLSAMKGRYAVALRQYADARAFAERTTTDASDAPDRQRSVTVAIERMATVKLDFGHVDEALKLRREALLTVEALARRAPHDLRAAADLAQSEHELSYACSIGGQRQEAERLAASAAERFQRLVDLRPDNAAWQMGLLESRSSVLGLRVFRGELNGVIEGLSEIVEGSVHLIEQEPQDIEHQVSTSNLFETLAEAYLDSGNGAKALEIMSATLLRVRAASQRFPQAVVLQDRVVATQSTLGDVQRANGDLTAALQSYRAAEQLSEQILQSDSANVDRRRRRNLQRSRIAQVLSTLGSEQEALNVFAALERDTRELLKLHPEHFQLQRDLHVHLGDIGQGQRTLGRLDLALAAQLESVRVAEALAKTSDGPLQTFDLAASLEMLAGVLVELERPSEAIVHYQRAYELTKGVAKQPAAPIAWRVRFAEAANRLGDVRLEADDDRSAELVWSEALAVLEQARREAPRDADVQAELADCRARFFNLAVHRSSPTQLDDGVWMIVEYVKACARAQGDAALANRLKEAMDVFGEHLRDGSPAQRTRTFATLLDAGSGQELAVELADSILAIGQYLALETLAEPQRGMAFVRARLQRKPGDPNLRCELAELSVAHVAVDSGAAAAIDDCLAGADRPELRLVGSLLRMVHEPRQVSPATIVELAKAVGEEPLTWSFAGLRTVLVARRTRAAARAAAVLRIMDEPPPEGRAKAMEVALTAR